MSTASLFHRPDGDSRAASGAGRALRRQVAPAYSMRAMGKSGLPAEIAVGGVVYRLVQNVKHDFFAATGFYDDRSGRRIVLKVGRLTDFAGIPLLWLGRWLCRREMRFYNRLSDLPNVPAVLATWGPTGFVHEYVPGRPLSPEQPVPDGFFDRLLALLREVHCREMAYVDTNKPQNILLGDDGKPHLIDFQISWDLRELGNTALNRWWTAQLQRADVYHALKHKMRLRPDELTRDECALATRRSRLIRLHRFVFKPWFHFRRRTFSRLRQSGRLLPEGSK